MLQLLTILTLIASGAACRPADVASPGTEDPDVAVPACTLTFLTSGNQSWRDDVLAERIILLDNPELVLSGSFRVAPDYQGLSDTPSVATDHRDTGIHVTQRQFTATKVVHEEYWLAAGEFNDILDDGSDVDMRMLDFGGSVSLVVDVMLDNRVCFGFVNVAAGHHALPAGHSERHPSGFIISDTRHAIESPDEEPVELILQRRIPKPGPGTLILSFDDFESPTVARRMKLSVDQSARPGVHLALQEFGDGRIRVRPVLRGSLSGR